MVVAEYLFTLRRCGFAKGPPDWFAKELSGQGLSRKRLSGTSGGRENSGKKKGSLPARCKKQDGQCGEMELWTLEIMGQFKL